jgi:hypothetical protein
MNTNPGSPRVKALAVLALLGLVGGMAAPPVQQLASGLWVQVLGGQLAQRVPEPWSALLVGLTLGLLAWHARRHGGTGRFS